MSCSKMFKKKKNDFEIVLLKRKRKEMKFKWSEMFTHSFYYKVYTYRDTYIIRSQRTCVIIYGSTINTLMMYS